MISHLLWPACSKPRLRALGSLEASSCCSPLILWDCFLARAPAWGRRLMLPRDVPVDSSTPTPPRACPWLAYSSPSSVVCLILRSSDVAATELMLLIVSCGAEKGDEGGWGTGRGGACQWQHCLHVKPGAYPSLDDGE